MGNDSGKLLGDNPGKVIGITVGAGLQLIPGVGTVLGAAILAGTTLVGSAVDAGISSSAQRAENDRIARETQAAQEEAIRQAQIRAQQEQDAQAKQLRHAQTQMELINRILTACRTGEISQVSRDLEQLDNAHFYNTLGQQPIAESVNPDVRDEIQGMLNEEQERRQLNFENPSRPAMGR